ncbi:hypothetical protein ACFJIX_03745 [Roseateles sp. UC29_93]|uniref:hypothetical protein n=1 Tax=Roseateles sp. UC29_93 TaxID=3350177 RepID=UPI00030ADDC1
MKFACSCGHVIVDQTDFLPYKAYLIADQDWEDHCDSFEVAWESRRMLDRTCYQCEQCGRLWIDDAGGQLQSFMPESPAGHRILRSSLGKAWRSPMAGSWTDRPFGDAPRGTLWCDAAPAFHQGFDDWGELERAYHALLSQLIHQDLVRSAFLSKNGEMLHRWSLEKTPTSADGSAPGSWWQRWWKSRQR